MEESQPRSFRDLTIAEFVDALSSAEPVPGGGAASAVAGALGAALISMVSNLSQGRPKYAAYERTLMRAQTAGWDLSARLLELADRDASAYAAYGSALKMPRETPTEQEARRRAMREAARGASEVPMDVVLACALVADAAESLAGRSNLNAASDVIVAALLAEAAAKGAAENVRINLPATGDDFYAGETEERLSSVLRDIHDATSRTREAALSGQLRDAEPA